MRSDPWIPECPGEETIIRARSRVLEKARKPWKSGQEKWWSQLTLMRKVSLSLSLFFSHLFRATPEAYASSQHRGGIGATAASLRHSHSNVGSKPRLRLTPQPTAMPDSRPTEWSQGSNPHLHGYSSDLFPLHHNGNSQERCPLLRLQRNWEEAAAGMGDRVVIRFPVGLTMWLQPSPRWRSL